MRFVLLSIFFYYLFVCADRLIYQQTLSLIWDMKHDENHHLSLVTPGAKQAMNLTVGADLCVVCGGARVVSDEVLAHVAWVGYYH